MANELKEGTKLHQIVFVDESLHQVDMGGCKELVIACQVGEMAMVPWVKATLESGRVILFNPAHLEGIELLIDGVDYG